jgi:hypothetical protein
MLNISGTVSISPGSPQMAVCELSQPIVLSPHPLIQSLVYYMSSYTIVGAICVPKGVRLAP